MSGNWVKGAFGASVAALAMMGVIGTAQADGVIYNGDGTAAGTSTIALGVKDLGNLNVTGGPAVNGGAPGATGIAIKDAAGEFRDATSPGCLCEGWGVSINGTDSGFANVSSGTGGLTLDSFVTDDPGAHLSGTTATSTVHLTSAPGLSVSQAYSVSDKTPDLFKDVVTITNMTGATVTDLKYVRVMDWDVPFTEFSEFVTIKGTATTTLLEFSNDQGFATADPLAGDPGAILGGTTNTDFSDSGPADHGAYFRFNFGDLADGESVTFQIFYGATYSERTALAAIAAESIELFSLGQSSPPSGDPADGTPFTFIFGFSGVGGVPVVGAPEPASIALLGAGMAALGLLRRRRKTA